MYQATSRATAAGAYRSPATPAPQSGFGELTTPLHWLVDQWQRIQAIRELNRLSDRHLRDIGIGARGDIETIAEEMIHRRRRR